MLREINSFVRRNGRITLGQKKYLDQYLEKYSVNINLKDNILENFNNNNPLILDIGFGNGEDLFCQAQNNPNYNFIGIEVYLSGIGALLKRVVNNRLDNIKILNGDAVEYVKNHLSENVVSRVQLLFPDPWHKKKHHKRRIIQIDFIENIYKVLCGNGVLHIVTDCEKYCEHIVNVVESFGKFIDC